MMANRARRGFTLIEITTVVAALLVLMAVALPVFLGSRNDAMDTRAKSDVTNSLHSARAGSAALGGFDSELELIAQLKTDNPALEFVHCDGYQGSEPCAGIQLDSKTLYVDLLTAAEAGSDGEEVTLCALSETRRFYCLRSNELGNIQGIVDELRGV